MGGGQDKLAWTAYPPGVNIIRVGGKISWEILPPGGQAVQGGKINCYTGIEKTRILTNFDIDSHTVRVYRVLRKFEDIAIILITSQ